MFAPRTRLMLGSMVTALALAACSDSAVAPGGNGVIGSAAFARKPSSSPGNPGDNNSCDNNDSGSKTRKSPNDKNQCGGGTPTLGRAFFFGEWTSSQCSGVTACIAVHDAADVDNNNAAHVVSLYIYEIGSLLAGFDKSKVTQVDLVKQDGTVLLSNLGGDYDGNGYWWVAIEDNWDQSAITFNPTTGDYIKFTYDGTEYRFILYTFCLYGC